MKSRLSQYNIDDFLIPAGLYADIRNGADAWTQYEIQPDERLMPELVSLRFYGTDELKWVVQIAAEQDDGRDGLSVGDRIALPPLAWVRQQIKRYADVNYRE